MATQTVEAVDHKLFAAGEWIETGEWAEVDSPYDGTQVGRVAQRDPFAVVPAHPLEFDRPAHAPILAECRICGAMGPLLQHSLQGPGVADSGAER
jgi:hypothetical protein